MKPMLALCALLSLAITCTAQGKTSYPRGATDLAGGQLWLKADTYDAYATLNLENNTPQPDNYKPYLPDITWWANGVRRWTTGFDVGPNYDFVPVYHYAPENPFDSKDVLYVTNEKWPRVGIMIGPTMKAQFHVHSQVPGRTGLITNLGNKEGWNTEWMLQGSHRSGVWNDGSLYVPRVVLTNASGDPGGELYVEGGALKFRGGKGTITTLAKP